MTYRVLAAIVAVLASAMLMSGLRAQPGGDLKLGEKYAGELTAKSTIHLARGYTAELPVALKAGKPIVITGTVVGDGRTVGMQLVDPSGKAIKETAFTVKTCNITFKELPANGKYKILLQSPDVGVFSIVATETAEDGDIKALKARVEQLESELADARRKLDALVLKQKDGTPKK
jgi:hypothetical protein